jgi:hypothetical protein
MNMKRNTLCAFLSAVLLTASIGWAEDPDYSNLADTAEPVLTNGTVVQGYLTSGDEDWFTFTPVANTLYRVTLTGEINMGYKEMRIYQEDAFGENLLETLYLYPWSNATSVQTFFIEKPQDIYIKLYSNPGNYSFKIEAVGLYLPDSYSDTCAAPTLITVDAAPISGTLTRNPDESLETDWFVFNTQPLHMYEIRLTKSDNTDVNFYTHSDSCQDLYWWSKNTTVTSWFGEPYKIQVAGHPAYLGTYYTLEVIDLGLQPDDYPNISDEAVTIPTNGTVIEGEIHYASSYGSDEDWFTFTPVQHTLYRVTLTGELNMGYKEMRIYQKAAFGENLLETLYLYPWSNATSVQTFFIEKPQDIFIKVYSNPGNYSFKIEAVGLYLPDSYSDACAAPTPITVDAAPISGTLTRNPDESLETDWFVFNTQPLHMYEIRLTKSDNTDVNFYTHSDSCQDLYWWSKNTTVTSWFGEPYKIQVAGNPVYLGTYYTLEVVDLGVQPDDFPNISTQAAAIPKDGTLIEGVINYTSNYGSDEDWFTFIAGQAGSYQFRLTGEINKGYKEMRIYWEDDLNVLREYKYDNVWSDAVKTFSVSLPAGKIYVKVYSNLGSYTFYVISPEPRCGDLDHPYPPGDANKDCYVNLLDVAMMAENWLTCNDPNPPCVVE